MVRRTRTEIKKYYGKEGAPLRILKVLKNLNTQNLFQKRFFNI